MYPSQLDAVNKYLERAHVKSLPVGKWAKLAAVMVSPLLFAPAFAQNTAKQETVSVPNEGDQRTEILILDLNGLPIGGIEVDVYSAGKKMHTVKSDATGKVCVYHKAMPNPVITLKNDLFGLDNTITLTDASICLNWQTDLDVTAINVNEIEVEFKFVWRDKHNKPIRNTSIEVTLYDDIAHVIKQQVVKTDFGGYAKVRTDCFEKITSVNYIVYAKDGDKWASSYELKKGEENLVEVNKAFREEVTAGIMVSDW